MDKNFEIGEHMLQFRCRYAVYRSGRESSICYTTNPALAEIIAEAMDRFSKQEDFESFAKAMEIKHSA